MIGEFKVLCVASVSTLACGSGTFAARSLGLSLDGTWPRSWSPVGVPCGLADRGRITGYPDLTVSALHDH